jgi:hypothetical protein
MTNTTQTLKYLQLTAQGMFEGINKLERLALSTEEAKRNLNEVLVQIVSVHFALNG